MSRDIVMIATKAKTVSKAIALIAGVSRILARCINV